MPTRTSTCETTLLVRHSSIYEFAMASDPWAPACGPVPPLARRALTGLPGSGGAGGDNLTTKV